MVWLQSNHLGQQVDRVLVHVLHMLVHGDAFPLRKGRLEVLELERFWPVVVVRCAQHTEDFEYLVDFRVTYKQSFALGHLRKDAADAPDVDWSGVLLATQQNLRCSVPQRDNLVCVSLDWQPKRSSQTKICKFDVSVLVYQ